MNRSQHIRFAKDRAMEYANRGELVNALNSLVSDLQKHPETKNHVAITLGTSLWMNGLLQSQEKVLRFIEGVN